MAVGPTTRGNPSRFLSRLLERLASGESQQPGRRGGRWARPSDEEVPEHKLHVELRTALYQLIRLALADRVIVGSDQFVSMWSQMRRRPLLATGKPSWPRPRSSDRGHVAALHGNA